MIVKIKKLHPDSVLPTGREGDAGLDLIATNVSETSDYLEYGTGLAIEIPKGFVGLIFPRSSISGKELALCNSVGVIDSGYRGEIKFRFKQIKHNVKKYSHVTNCDRFYDVGDRIGQLIIMPYPNIVLEEVQELSITERNAGGFGSSGI